MKQNDCQKAKNSRIRHDAPQDGQLLRRIFPDGSPTLEEVLPKEIPTLKDVTVSVDTKALICELEQEINK